MHRRRLGAPPKKLQAVPRGRGQRPRFFVASYPAFMRWLEGARAKEVCDSTVNVAARVGATKSGWTGFNLFVMCPDRQLAEEVIPAFAAVLAKYGFAGTAEGVLRMLSEAKSNPEAEEQELWPREAPPLMRTGSRRTMTTR